MKGVFRRAAKHYFGLDRGLSYKKGAHEALSEENGSLYHIFQILKQVKLYDTFQDLITFLCTKYYRQVYNT